MTRTKRTENAVKEEMDFILIRCTQVAMIRYFIFGMITEF